MWCGHDGGLVPAEKVAAWAAEAGVYSFGLYEEAELIAYGELWVDHDEAEVELARLIVDPARRGRGVGRLLVAQLSMVARAMYPNVFLRVHPANAAALRCYGAAGFERATAQQEAQWNAEQPVPYVWLTQPMSAAGG
jgi:ribosomal protein S18 acetylase RimI-like enzyme